VQNMMRKRQLRSLAGSGPNVALVMAAALSIRSCSLFVFKENVMIGDRDPSVPVTPLSSLAPSSYQRSLT
jgi:hypothetical protein